jgi:endoglycosylceramidase
VSRRPRLGFALGALILLGTMLPGGARAAAGSGWADAGIVQAPGGPYLTDALGRRLQLHGANLVAKCGGGARPTTAAGTPCVGPAQGPRLAYVLSPAAIDPARRFTASNARTLASLGFNVVRLGIVWEGLEPGRPGVGPNDPVYCGAHPRGAPFPSLGRANPYDPPTVRAYLARTDKIIALLAGAGLRVVIDMHQDAWGSAFFDAFGPTPWNGEGAPPWATCTVARHYRSSPNVIGYEVVNEPNDFLSTGFNGELQCDYGGPAHEPRSCAASHAAALPNGLIGAIQAADPNHVVLFEPSGATNFGAPETIGITEPLRFHSLVLAFHMYGAAAGQVRQTTQERARTRTDQPGGPAWIMDEFGASNNSPVTATTVSLADASNLSWTYWATSQLDDPTAADPFEGLLNEQTRRPYPAQARAMAVPYPWATAGAPGRQSFDRRTRTFKYSYAVDPAIHAPTQISLPAYTYPHGYSVRVAGATIASGTDSPILELLSRPGVRRVAVTVR